MARVSNFWKRVGDSLESVFPAGASILIKGVDRYINFGSEHGSSGYGFRDNAGTLQFKSSSGEWANFGGGSTAAVIPMIILIKSSSINQNVGGANGSETYWTWDGETIKDDTFTHDNTTNSERVTVADDGWYEITFIGGAQTTGSSRTTLQGIHRVNGGTTSRAGSLRNYTRGASYGNITTGIIYTVQLTAGDYIEVGTRVEDSDGAYTINTNGGEISDDCHQLVIKKIR